MHLGQDADPAFDQVQARPELTGRCLRALHRQHRHDDLEVVAGAMGQLPKQEILFPFHRVEPLQQQPEGLCHQGDDNGTGEKDEQGNGIGLGWNDQAEARLDEQEHRQKGAEDSRVEASPAIQQQSGERHGWIVEDERVTPREGSGDQLHHCYYADARSRRRYSASVIP